MPHPSPCQLWEGEAAYEGVKTGSPEPLFQSYYRLAVGGSRVPPVSELNCHLSLLQTSLLSLSVAPAHLTFAMRATPPQAAMLPFLH